jgi:hypothetical protein
MSKRGSRRVSLRVRLAVATALVASGGAAGAVALSASDGGPVKAQPAGYYRVTSRTLSYTSAVSAAMRGWDKSPGTSLMTISNMRPVHNYWTQSWHRAIIFIQRGTVVAVGHGEFAVRSADGRTEIWHVNHGTKTLNVGGSPTGLSAMTGGTTTVPSWWQMNTKARGVARGDLVFVFGERENHTLKAQLVLFAAPTRAATRPATTRPAATMPAATMPAATATATMPTATATMPPATMPPATMPPATRPAATPTSTVPTFSGPHS